MAATVGATTPVNMEAVLMITPVMLTFDGGTRNSRMRKPKLSHDAIQVITRKVAT